MHSLGKWLFTTVMTLCLVGSVNVWTTEDLEEFRVNWQDYPHHELGDAKPEPRSYPDTGSARSIDMNHGEFRVAEEILLVETMTPEFSGMGENFMVSNKVTALEDAAEIVVKTSVPEGATYVKSEPMGQLMGDEVVWKFDKMHKGDFKELKVWFRPSGEGDYASCTKAHAWPIACVVTKVRTPNLTIEKSGPEKATLGDHVNYTITVTNDGSAAAEDVVITDFIPRGMLFDGSGEKVMYEVGTLDAGESKTIDIDLEATERGYFCNKAQVSSSNANTVSDDACTQIMVQGIEISKSGPAKTFVGKSATYTIRVRNTGDTELTNVRVRDDAASGTDIVSANGADFSSSSAEWMIDRLGAGESRTFSVTIDSDNTGTYCNEASVSAAEGVSDEAEACTLWEGHPAILMELIDVEDPLLVGESTTYEVRITNQGTADDKNIKVNVSFPSQVQPMSARGATDGQVSGRSVSFDAYDVLKPGQSIEYFIEAKATGKGDARIELQLDSDLLRKPVVEEESTHVY